MIFVRAAVRESQPSGQPSASGKDKPQYVQGKGDKAYLDFQGRVRYFGVGKPEFNSSGKPVTINDRPYIRFYGESATSIDIPVGHPVYVDQGVLYDQNGQILGEMGLDNGKSGAFLDGVSAAANSFIVGLADFIRHPIKSLSDLIYLPKAIGTLIENSPEFWYKFKDMTPDEQWTVYGRIAGEIAVAAGTYVTGAEIGNLVKGASITLPVMELSVTTTGEAVMVLIPKTIAVGEIAGVMAGRGGKILYAIAKNNAASSPQSAESKKIVAPRLGDIDIKEISGVSRLESGKTYYLIYKDARNNEQIVRFRFNEATLRKLMKNGEKDKFFHALKQPADGPKNSVGIKIDSIDEKNDLMRVKINGGNRLSGKKRDDGVYFIDNLSNDHKPLRFGR